MAYLKPSNFVHFEHFQLKILATDQGYPDQYSTSLTMVVVILDKNDHKPEFEGFAAPHPLSMEENTPNACVSVDLAVDKDLNTTYTSICYYLIGKKYQPQQYSYVFRSYLRNTVYGKEMLLQFS